MNDRDEKIGVFGAVPQHDEGVAPVVDCDHDYKRSQGGHHSEHYTCKLCRHQKAYYWPSHEWWDLGYEKRDEEI